MMSPQSRTATPQSRMVSPQSRTATPQSRMVAPQGWGLTPQDRMVPPEALAVAAEPWGESEGIFRAHPGLAEIVGKPGPTSRSCR